MILLPLGCRGRQTYRDALFMQGEHHHPLYFLEAATMNAEPVQAGDDTEVGGGVHDDDDAALNRRCCNGIVVVGVDSASSAST